MIVDVADCQHRQYQRAKLLDELAVTEGEFARRTSGDCHGAPRAHDLLTVCNLGRACRHQGVESQVRLWKLVRPSIAAGAGPGSRLRVRARSRGDEQHSELVGKTVARVRGRKAQKSEGVFMFLPYARFRRRCDRRVAGEGDTPRRDTTQQGYTANDELTERIHPISSRETPAFRPARGAHEFGARILACFDQTPYSKRDGVLLDGRHG